MDDETEQLLGNLAGDLLAMAGRGDKTIHFEKTEANLERAQAHAVLHQSGLVSLSETNVAIYVRLNV